MAGIASRGRKRSFGGNHVAGIRVGSDVGDGLTGAIGQSSGVGSNIWIAIGIDHSAHGSDIAAQKRVLSALDGIQSA